MTSTGSTARPGTEAENIPRDERRYADVTRGPEQIRDDLVERAASGEPELAELIRLYYRYVPPEEVIDDDPVDLAGAVRSHRQLAKLRALGRPAVRVLNPSREADGWSCMATVVQVVTDDMPYLVDSVISELTRAGFALQRLAHPIVVVRRDVAGTLHEVLPTADPARPLADAAAESWMYLEIDRITDPGRARELENRLGSVLGDVREVVEDSEKMIGTAHALADSLEADPPPIDPRDVADGARLLRWLASGHFTFLGYRHYELVSDTGEFGQNGGAREPGFRGLRAVLASGLGVLRSDSLAARSLTAGPDSGSAALSPELLVLTQAGAPSTVHRSVYPYYVGVPNGCSAISRAVIPLRSCGSPSMLTKATPSGLASGHFTFLGYRHYELVS
ncbi:MAG: hypothetical protein ACRDQ5_04300, partial [Sciscionella sp.]